MQTTIWSIVRTLITLAGTYLVGLNLFGHPLDSNTFQIIGGIIMTLGSVIWGIVDKSASIEQVQSGIRSAFIAGGGLLIAWGKLSAQQLELIIGLIVPVLTVLQSYTSKVKVQQINSGQLKANVSGQVTKVLIFIILCLGIAANGQAQSILHSLPKSTAIPGTIVATTLPVLTPDSVKNAFRPLVGVAAFSEPGSQLMTGAGIGYQHLKWDYTVQKWNAEWSISALAWGAGSVQPGPQTPAFAFGPAFGFFNNLILVGGAYDFTHGQWIGCLSLGISLNN
jgi:hypothetical protein